MEWIIHSIFREIFAISFINIFVSHNGGEATREHQGNTWWTGRGFGADQLFDKGADRAFKKMLKWLERAGRFEIASRIFVPVRHMLRPAHTQGRIQGGGGGGYPQTPQPPPQKKKKRF